MNKVIQGNCLDVMKTLEDNSVDAIVTDPPYGLSFMGKKWDYDVPSVEIWQEALRVLKPGGYLLAFAGTRTQHRMAVRIEDAGFEIRDMIAWIYGSGFPKSLNIGKVMDKFIKTGNASWNGTGDSSNGALGYSKLQHQQGYRPADYSNKHQDKSEITEDKAKQWEGWGTALKPALEPITVARKPLNGTVANNVLKWGVGGINIDGCRVPTNGETPKGSGNPSSGVDIKAIQPGRSGGNGGNETSPLGRFPANLIHDGSDEVVGLFPNTKTGSIKPYKYNGGTNNLSASVPMFSSKQITSSHTGDFGSAARFFYCAKASKSERNRGCEELDDKISGGMAGTQDQTLLTGSGNIRNNIAKNNHPTVKPIALMEYLVKLVSPENSTVLDPFAGSGSTLIACKNLGREYIGIEMNPEYIEIINARLNYEPELKQEKLL